MSIIYNFIKKNSLQYQDNVFLVEDYSNTSITYKEYLKKLENSIQYLGKHINLENTCFSIIADNSIDYTLALFGMQAIGHIAVNMNPNLTVTEIIYRLNYCDTKILITTSHYYNNLHESLKNTKIAICILLDFLPNTTHDSIEYIIFSSNENSYQLNIKEIKDAFLQFTGGTSGVTKAAILSHENIIANINQISEHIRHTATHTGNHIIIITFPFYHVFSITFNLLHFINSGSSCIIIKSARDIDNLIHVLDKYPITFIVAVNTLYKLILQHNESKNINFSNLKYCIGGGEHIQYSTKIAWKELTGIPIYEAYGLTETSAMAIVNPLNESNNLHAIGIPLPNTKIALLDENDNIITENNCKGEIAIKGPQVTNEYYKNPIESSQAFTNGWFKTGDIAERFLNGFYKIVDRKKDMISVSGNKVYPNEVEEIIAQYHGILDVAVVGKASEKSGEVVAACLVVKEQLNDDFIAYCSKNLASFKLPKYIFIFDSLPKSPIGKTQRNVLKKIINEENHTTIKHYKL